MENSLHNTPNSSSHEIKIKSNDAAALVENVDGMVKKFKAEQSIREQLKEQEEEEARSRSSSEPTPKQWTEKRTPHNYYLISRKIFGAYTICMLIMCCCMLGSAYYSLSFQCEDDGLIGLLFSFIIGMFVCASVIVSWIVVHSQREEIYAEDVTVVKKSWVI
jgi:hypothetical protein